MMTEWDARLFTNGNAIITEFDDEHDAALGGWEHNVVAARWSPQTGWTLPA